MRPCLSYALNPDGRAVSIAEVPSGLACNCACPGCGEPLIAKKGRKRSHYFSHASNSECKSGYESSVHLAVKAILERTKALRLPRCIAEHAPKERLVETEEGLRTVTELEFSYLKHDPRDTWVYADQFDRHHPRHGYATLPAALVTFDRVSVETREGRVVPDLIGHVGDKRIFIEVAVTHFVGDDKMAKLRSLNVSTIELDFSDGTLDLAGWAELEDRVLNSDKGKRWLWNQKANSLASQDRTLREHRMAPYLAELAKLEVTHRSSFELTHGGDMDVVLCDSFVGVRIVGNLAYGHQRTFAQWMKAANAVFHEPTNQWRLLPATEDYWIRVERLLRSSFHRQHAGWTLKVPPGERQRIQTLIGKHEKLSQSEALSVRHQFAFRARKPV